MEYLKYNTGLKRVGAAIVDGIIFMPLIIVEQELWNNIKNNSVIIYWIIFASFLPIFYSILLHYKYGQTLGKWVTGVKVIDISECRKLTLRQSIFRDLFYLAAEVIGLLYFSFIFFQTKDIEHSINDFRNFTEQSILWWTIIELVSMLTNLKRRAIYDFIAKSVVVRA